MSATNTRGLIDRFLRSGRQLALPSVSGVSGVSVRHYGPTGRGDFGLVHTRLVTSAALSATLGATGNRAGGVKLFDFPLCGIIPVAARARFTASLSAGTATFDMADVGLGTVIGSGNVAVLGGTATFEDIGFGRAGAAIGAGASVAQDLIWAVGGRDALDGRGTAKDLHLNVAGAVGVATTNLSIAAGAIFDVLWVGIRDS